MENDFLSHNKTTTKISIPTYIGLITLTEGLSTNNEVKSI